jgi:hypothetical protein
MGSVSWWGGAEIDYVKKVILQCGVINLHVIETIELIQ